MTHTSEHDQNTHMRIEDWPRSSAFARLLASPLVQVLALVVLALLAYGNTLRNGFVSEDFDFVYRMAHTPWSAMWQLFVPAPVTPYAAPAFYRPFGFLLWKIGWTFGGYDPLAQHLINLGLHLANGLLLYALLLRVLAWPRRMAWTAAALFVVFPAHSEAVTWLAGRFDVGAGTWTLLALLCALGIRRKGLGVALGCLCFALALTSKEVAMMVPGLLALLIVVVWLEQPQPHSIRLLVREGTALLLPFAIILLGYLALRWYLFSGIGGYVDNGKPVVLQASWQSLGDSLLALGMFLTLPLNWFSLLQYGVDGGVAGYLLGLTGGVLVGYMVWRTRNEQVPATLLGTLGSELLLGLGWAVIACVPAALLSADAETLSSSRFVYIASMGICIALTALLFRLELVVRDGVRTRSIPAGRAIVAGCVVALCCLMLVGVNQHWQQAGKHVAALVADVREELPTLEPQTTLLLPTLPDNYKGAYILRNGVESALRIAYGDDTLHVAHVSKGEQFNAPLARPDRVYQFVLNDGDLDLQSKQSQIAARLAAQNYTPGIPTLGWRGDFYKQEQADGHQWRWMRRTACLSLDAPVAQQIDLRMRLWSPGPTREVRFSFGGKQLRQLAVTQAMQDVVFTGLEVSPGSHCLQLQSNDVASIDSVLHNGDTREISVAVGDVVLTLSPHLAAAPMPEHVLQTSFGDSITLLGYDLRRAPGALAPEQQMTLTLYWRCDQTPSSDLSLFVHLADQHKPVAQADGPPGGSAASTRTWRQGEFWRSTVTLTVPPETSPGLYRLLVGLYDPLTGKRLPIQSSNSLDDALVLENLPIEQ